MQHKDAIVILGRGINQEGILSPCSIKRVQAAAKLYHEGVASHLIPSSKWCFTAQHPPKKTIADAMKETLISLNVPESNIIVENESCDTIGNFYLVKQILLAHQWYQIVVVTSYSHEARSVYLAKKILGPKFITEFVTVEDGITGDELIHQNKFEKKLLRKMKLLSIFYPFFKNGDDHAIKRILKAKHPYYRKLLDEL